MFLFHNILNSSKIILWSIWTVFQLVKLIAQILPATLIDIKYIKDGILGGSFALSNIRKQGL